MADWLEHFWGEVLSRDALRVKAAIQGLTDLDERMAVIAHLHNMATESGWTEPQRLSAQAALKALNIDPQKPI